MGIYKKHGNYYIDYYADGRRKREMIGPNRKLAVQVLAKRRTEIAEGRFLDVKKSSRCTFEDAAEKYFEWSRANKRSWERDQRALKVLSKSFGGKRLDAIAVLDVESFKTSRRSQVGPASVNRELACLKAMFNKAIRWDLAAVNPVCKVSFFRENNERLRYLTHEEFTRLYEASNAVLRPIVVIAVNTGMRKGELLNLRWQDVKFLSKLIYVRDSKSGEGRQIPMNDSVLVTLSALPQRGEYVFTHTDGRKVTSFRTAFERARRVAEIEDFRFHDLRHTFASHLVQSGVDLYTVKELLGHKTLRMTMRYAHLSPQWKAREVDRLKFFDGHYLDTEAQSAVAGDSITDYPSGDCRSGGIGRHQGLKIPWAVGPCRFESGLRHILPARTRPRRPLYLSVGQPHHGPHTPQLGSGFFLDRPHLTSIL